MWPSLFFVIFAILLNGFNRNVPASFIAFGPREAFSPDEFVNVVDCAT